MADNAGRPIHENLPVSPIGGVAANVDVDPDAPRCVACGRYHGGTTEGIRCLEREIIRARNAATQLARRLAITNIIDATVQLLICARFLGEVSKTKEGNEKEATEGAAVEVARAALGLEYAFSIGSKARELAGLVASTTEGGKT
jgi:hypothetical protein